MDKVRLIKLRQIIHDDVIRCKTSHENGKTTATTNLVGDVLGRVEKLIQILLEE